MKKAIKRVGSVLKGVSTLDIVIRNPRIILLLLISMAALSATSLGGHSTLDVVDPSFDLNIRTSSLGCKFVDRIIPLSDGKILVAGTFNSYNGQPVGGLIRLNADATLDTTFHSELARGSGSVVVLADGKLIIVATPTVLEPSPLIRLNADGTKDTTFLFSGSGTTLISALAIDAADRVIVAGSFLVGNGSTSLIRLNSDGSRDTTFVYPLGSIFQVNSLATQNNKIIFSYIGSSAATVERVNENGTIDSSFETRNFLAHSMIVQPDGKILLRDTFALRRLNQDGSDDTGFTVTTFAAQQLIRWGMGLSAEGKITIAVFSGAQYLQIRKFLPDGTEDGSFTPFLAVRVGAIAVQPDGGVLIGDSDGASCSHPLLNDFVRLSPNGSPDPTFDTGIGFQSFFPGVVRGINVQPDGKILIGGRFDFVNDVQRSNIARINADSTVDTSFEINTSGGNYFTNISNFDTIRTQSDGKILATGDFIYQAGGGTKSNLVRLNSDGSIDPTFDLGVTIRGSGYGPLRFETFDDGRLLVGNTRFNFGDPTVPLKLTTTGEIDPSFISGVFPEDIPVYIYDVLVQPDRKVIISGRRHVNTVIEPVNTEIWMNKTRTFTSQFGLNSAGGEDRSFLIRLNADGSLDPTFQPHEQLNNVVPAFVLMPDGKIVFSETDLATSQSRVSRVNANGTADPTFNAGIANGRVNTMLLLSTGRLFVGGRFNTFNGQSRGNLVQLNADGSVFTPVYQLNDEVLCLAVDGDGRVFVGGSFTTIIAGSTGGPRSYVAGLIDARTQFDFDGDGKADVSVFRPSDKTWYLNRSSNGFAAVQFGLSTDKIIPADFDGDGKTDVSVYRAGIWYWLNSSDGVFKAFQFGVSSDLPVPADYTGDGRSELAVYRSGTWWTYDLATQQASAVQFGTAADKPVAADYDGDGLIDPAIYRGNGEWHLNRSTLGYTAVNFGIATDRAVPADYDGDGKADPAVYRDGTWYLLQSSHGFAAFQFGIAADTLAPADYDGDGKTDLAVYRTGTWYVLKSTGGVTIRQFGLADDKPIPAAFVP